MAAPKGNKYAKGNAGGGRPTLYKPKYAEIAERMCSKGATRAELADRFGVAIATVVSWQLEHEEFSSACKQGQEKADDRVEASFYERAVGYTYDGEKLFQYEGEIIHEPIKVHVPPGINAGRFWLCNRRPERWRELSQIEPRAPQEESPLVVIARQLANSAMRPRALPPPKPIKVEEGMVVRDQEKDAPPPRPIGKGR